MGKQVSQTTKDINKYIVWNLSRIYHSIENPDNLGDRSFDKLLTQFSSEMSSASGITRLQKYCNLVLDQYFNNNCIKKVGDICSKILIENILKLLEIKKNVAPSDRVVVDIPALRDDARLSFSKTIEDMLKRKNKITVISYSFFELFNHSKTTFLYELRTATGHESFKMEILPSVDRGFSLHQSYYKKVTHIYRPSLPIIKITYLEK
jgi:hypothetical protein